VKRTFGAAIFAALIIAAVPVNAAEMTAKDLQEMCTATDDISKNQCEFYILGVAQGADLVSAAAPTKDKAHCMSIPAGMNYEAIVLAVKMKMGQDLMVFPADLNSPAVSVVAAVLVSTFPCGKKWH
jgi:hypothetical protein